MKIAIDASVILKKTILVDIIDLMVNSGYKVYITYNSNNEDDILKLLKEKKCKCENLRKYDSSNKYKILGILNLNYILDDDQNLLFDNNRKLYSNTRIGLYDNKIDVKNDSNVFQGILLKPLLNDFLKHEDNIKKKIEEPIELTGKPSIDKPWTRTYSISQDSVNLLDMSIWEYIYLSNYGREDEVALRYFGKTITFKQLYKKVDEFALKLVNMGIKQGDVVTICMPNTPEGVIAFLAINKIGAVASMLHPLLKSYDILDTLNITNSKIMIMADMSYGEVKDIIDKTNLKKVFVVSPSDSMPIVSNIQPGIKLLYIAKEKIKRHKNKLKLKRLNKAVKVLDGTFKDIEKVLTDEISKIKRSIETVSYDDDRFIKWDDMQYIKGDIISLPNITYNPSNTSVLLRTGGTTGRPKLAGLSDKSIVANISQVRDSIPPYETGDEVLAISPIFHGFGLIESILAALGLNMSVDLHPQYNKPIFVKSLLKNKPALVLGVPTLWDNLIKDKKLNKSDFVPGAWISGGDKLTEHLKAKINKFRNEHQNPDEMGTGYGFTEGGAAVTISKHNGELSEQSVGYPLPHNNVKIINQTTGEECGYGETGEIWISGPTLMNEYYKMPESTEKAIKISKDGIRWYRTGDLGYVNENGELCFNGRDKNLIIVSGVNVFGSEIEPFISKIPEVIASAVVRMPHDYKKNVPMAYVVLQDGIELDEQLKNKIIQICNSQVDTYHKIYDVVQIDKIPLTALSKIDYKKLEAMNEERYNNNNNKSKTK